MKTLVFDTETTGLRRKNKPEPSLTQIAAILFDGKEELGCLSCFVYPLDDAGDPVSVPNERFFVGVAEKIVVGGLPLVTALDLFVQMACQADRLVAHNIAFDYPILLANCHRVGVDPKPIQALPRYCTMKNSTDVCKLPSAGFSRYKWPKLSEAYEVLVDHEGFSGAHNALHDVKATAEVLWRLDTLT